MKTVSIYKAQPVHSEQKIESVTILIDKTLPHIDRDIVHWRNETERTDEIRRRFILEATTLAQALTDSLPQGTLDALLIRLLEAKMSLLHTTPRNMSKEEKEK